MLSVKRMTGTRSCASRTAARALLLTFCRSCSNGFGKRTARRPERTAASVSDFRWQRVLSKRTKAQSRLRAKARVAVVALRFACLDEDVGLTQQFTNRIRSKRKINRQAGVC